MFHCFSGSDPIIDDINARLDRLESTAQFSAPEAPSPNSTAAPATQVEDLSTTDVNDADFDMKQGVYTHPVHEGGTVCALPYCPLLTCMCPRLVLSCLYHLLYHSTPFRCCLLCK